MRHLGVTEAEELARAAHAGQTGPDGCPFMEHPLRVAHAVRSAGGDTTAVVVALLHDSIEKGTATRAGLHAAGATEAVLSAVDALTQGTQEPVSAYLARCRDNPIARTVKRYDLLDKLEPRYLSAVSGFEATRLAATIEEKLDQLDNDSG
jgi:(p)ppGpp synthase/HD superfamily hydrolase